MSFEDAVRARLGLVGEYQITCEASGGGQYQIGDYTWDSEPYVFELVASPITIHVERRKAPSLFGRGYAAWERGEQPEPTKYDEFTFHKPDPSRPTFSQEFDSIPALWAWLDEKIAR